MDIFIEIGTPEEQEHIRKELEMIKTISDPLVQISAIFVPADFDKKVNELNGTSDYSSTRTQQQVVGKFIKNRQGTYLVFSTLLYLCDYFTRFQFYIHELLHVVNETRFPSLENKNLSKSQRAYLDNLYIFFDEYDVDRKSLNIMDNLFLQLPSQYKRKNSFYIKGLIKPLIKQPSYYETIVSEIRQFRVHGIKNQSINNISPHFDQAAKAIIHSYAIIDHYPKYKRFIPFLLKSKFINEKTINLIEFYRKKFNENNADLFDGIDLMADFMENFGLKYLDTPLGFRVDIIDI